MKIVSWNCHYGFSDEKYEHIKGFKPDILIVQESTKKDFDRIKKNWAFKKWHNDEKYEDSPLGVAIFSNKYIIEKHKNFKSEYRYLIPYEIYDGSDFLFYLFAVWTKGKGKFSYEQNVIKAFESNAYDDMEEFLAKCKLINCIEDEELKSKDTYKHAEGKYGRDDFCFISKEFKKKYLTDVSIANFDGNKKGKYEYKGLSDHVPLTVTITKK